MEAQALLADLFPAEVALPDGRVERKARVFVTDMGIYVIAQRDSGQARIVYADKHAAPPELQNAYAPRSRPRKVFTRDGEVIVRLAGCACGSTLGAVTLDQVLRKEITAE